MEKRFQILDEKTLEVTVLVVLTDVEIALMESPDLRKQIDTIAKDLHVRWAVESNGNVTQACISKLFSPIATSADAHQLEIKATNFMSAVNKLTLPVFDPDECCPSHEEAEVLAEELEFVKKLKGDEDNIRAAIVIPCGMPPELAAITGIHHTVSHACMIRMINAYLKEYDHE